MLVFLLESAGRSMALGLVVWMALRLFRIRSPQDRSLVWTGVLLAAMTLPGLMTAIEALFAGVQSKPIPAAASIFLRPLPAAPTSAAAVGTDWMTVATVIYIGVGAALLLRVLVGLLRGWHTVRTASRIEEPWTRGWDVRASTRVRVPVTFGSTILLPPDWPHWSALTRDAVLAHEQSHIRRCDFAVHLLATIHRAVFWFSPMAWWIQRQLLEMAEVASDDAAIEKVQDRLSYADILIDVARKGSGMNSVGLAMANGHTVERRVIRLLEDSGAPAKVSRYARVALLGALVPLAGMFAGAWLVQVQAKSTTTPVALAPAQPTEPTGLGTAPEPARQTPQQLQIAEPGQRLSNWMEQEVPDIAAEEERQAFQTLNTDEEREAFIASFWLTRDPTPGTPQNEFKDEYYRRVARANQLYGTLTGISGWLTDRGRILVRFGQPDELESHPNPPTTVPFEKWRYRHIEGIGDDVILEFVDVDRNGNYHLTLDPVEKNVIIVPLSPQR